MFNFLSRPFQYNEYFKVAIVVFIFYCFLSCNSKNNKENYGAVSTAAPEATEIGMEILKAGGNAADAAVAIAFALGMAEPAMSGIGGGIQIQILLPGEKKPFAINGTTFSPGATPTDLQKDSLSDLQRTTIPSTVKTMALLKQNYGNPKIFWADLINPSIELAAKGVDFGPYRMAVYNKYLDKIKAGLPGTSDYLMDSTSGRFFYPKLARTYSLIAKDGPEVFYRGEIAQGIASQMESEGGFIAYTDLRELQNPKIDSSKHLAYLGHDIYTQPEPCGGWVVLEILNHLADAPDPQRQLIEAIYAGHQARIDVGKIEGNIGGSGETTHFSVVDREGRWIGVTASINAYYGNGIAHSEYGFLYNSYMDDFEFDDPHNKYAIGPNKMAYSSMSPTVVMHENKPLLVLGSPGSSRIISTVAQLIHYFIIDPDNRDDLLEKYRVHATSTTIFLENMDDKHLYNLENLPLLMVKSPITDLSINHLNPYFGGVHMIYLKEDILVPIADPRRDGAVAVE
jgi:gamma-glutamyltranspeptidase/glutathione hydrolase